MGYASQQGRARISATSPRAAAVCDRCGWTYSKSDLHWQMEFAGMGLVNLRILVCDTCLDKPQPQLRAKPLPPDPVPILNPRPENYDNDSIDYLTTTAPPTTDPATGLPVYNVSIIQTQDGQDIVTQPIGAPNGLEQIAVMPLNGTIIYGQPVPVLSITSNGTDQIAVTCSAPHGLSTNAQVSIEGLLNNDADGFYSIIVTTATAFTYQTVKIIPTNSLLQSTSNVITASVGLPRGFTQIPLTGG
jgi:hypothetical protein